METIEMLKSFDKSAMREGCYISDWNEIVPLTDAAELPELPLQSIKELGGCDWFTNLIEAVAAAFNLPQEIVYCNAIGAVAACTMKNFIVYTDERKLHTNLYNVFVYPPSKGKSTSQDILFRSIYDYEEGLQLGWQREKELFEEEHQDKKKAIKFDKPCPQLIADNCTPESILPMVKNNNGKMAIVSAEDSLFPLLTGLYSKKNSPQTDVFKKFFSNEPTSTNRKVEGYSGTVRGLLTVVLGTQPAAFEAIDNTDILTGDGTLSRFLYCYPNPLPPRHRNDRPELNKAALAKYYETLSRLTQQTNYRNRNLSVFEPVEFRLSDAAFNLFFDYEHELQIEIDPYDVVAPWLGRCAEFAGRLAANLHIIRHIRSCNIDQIPQEVGGDTMQAAIDIIRANEAHTRRAYGLFKTDQRIVKAKKILNWLARRNLREEFNRGELYHKNGRRWAGVSKPSDLDGAFEVLIENNYIRPRQQTTPEPHRPSEIYLINPNI